jgi:hypothetical protein
MELVHGWLGLSIYLYLHNGVDNYTNTFSFLRPEIKIMGVHANAVCTCGLGENKRLDVL